MKTKLIFCLALILSGVLLGCSETDRVVSATSSEPSGKLYETHSFRDRPTVAIYMNGFVDSSFSACIREGSNNQMLFVSLPAMKSQFESATNSIVGRNHANRTPNNAGEKMYDLFWSTNLHRFALAFRGNWVAACDCQTGQKIQITDGRENKFQCTVLGATIKRFLDGETVTDTEVAKVRKQSYSER